LKAHPHAATPKPRKPPAQDAKPIPARAASVATAPATVKITPARTAAFEILALVGEGKGHSDELLHSHRTAALSPEDRNLATALVMGVLRWQIALDARIARLLARPGQRVAEPVALALRMGTFQLLHMDRIPPHAALSESVELCRASGQPHATGMVNAVLRKLAAANPTSQNRDAGHQPKGVPIFESPAAFAERLAHPLWLVDRWIAAYGRDAALAICEYDQHEPHAGGLFREEAPRADADSPSPSESAPQMDDGSRLIAELAAAALPATQDRVPRVWDCCAAPGGKTLQLARRLPAAEILATDISAKRLTQVAARLRHYGYTQNVRCAVADASAPVDDPQAAFDLILCDVPCSGTGTLARNPEIRLRLRPEDLARHAQRQRAILGGALCRLAPGGRLLYSTCSLEPEENQRVIEAVASSAGVRQLAIAPFLGQLGDSGVLQPEVTASLLNTAIFDGALRTLPGIHPCDGFYAILLERN
jgi:16S rRNA (cytosine967-C5)-methyltransferase